MTMHRESEGWQDQLLAMGFTQAQISRANAAGSKDVTSAIDHITANLGTESSDKHARSSATAALSSSSHHSDQYPPLISSNNNNNNNNNINNSNNPSRPSGGGVGLSNARNSLDRMPRTSTSSARHVTTADTPMLTSSGAQDDDLSRALELSRREQDERDMARAMQISKQDDASQQAAEAERDPQLIRALKESLNDNHRIGGDRNVSWQSHAFASPAERVRHNVDDPVGLRNIGNTCYLNSLLQVYFHLPQFRRAVMSFRPREDLLPLEPPATEHNINAPHQPEATTALSSAPNRDEEDQAERKSDTTTDIKLDGPPSDVDMTPAPSASLPSSSPQRPNPTPLASPPQPQNSPIADHASDKSDNRSDARSVVATRNAVIFVVELQKLFAAMALGNQNCADPTAVLRAMRDPEGKLIEIGDQQDASEFNILFLDIVEKGLQAESSTPTASTAPSSNFTAAIDAKDAILDAPSPSETTAPAPPNIVKDLFTVKFRQEVRSCPPPSNPSDPRDEDMAPIVTNGETNCIIVDATSRDGRTLHNGLDDYAVARIDYKLPTSEERDSKNADTGTSTSPSRMDIARSNDAATSSGEIKSNGEVSSARPAMKRVWFSKIPPVMVIYLQRVRFNREKGLAEKVHSKYEFGTEVSFDRYLEENREASAQARERVLGIRKERRRLLSVVKKYRYFPDGLRDPPVSGSAEDDHTGLAGSGDDDEVMGEGVYFQSVDRIQERLRHELQASAGTLHESNSGVEPDAIEAAQAVLQRIADHDRRQCTAVEKSLESLENESEAYRDMERMMYGLHAVLVHDGAPSSGHYWTFIRDWEASETEDKTWLKFSDSAVARVTEKDMLRWSLGGSGTASAYCLIYTRPTSATETAIGSRRKSSISIAEESKSLLPPARVTEVEEAAQKFEKELADSKEKTEDKHLPNDTQQW